MLDDNEIFENIYNKLFIYRKFFQGLILTNEQVNKFIEKAENFNQILNILNYLGNSFQNFIKIIISNFEKIFEMSGKKVKEKKTENKNYVIKNDNYVVPNCNDNLEEIYENLVLLINFEKEHNNQTIVKFTPEFFIPYINYNADNNLNNLIFLNDIISGIKKIEKKFQFEEDLNKYIHNTGIKLIEEKKLKNQEILLFIEKDIYYNDKSYAKDESLRSVKVLDGIDAQTLNMKYWKKFNFKEMFKYQIDKFAKKVVSFIKDMKDFGKLYRLLKIDEIGDIPNEYILELKNRYKELMKTYSEKSCPNFLEDSGKLLKLVNKNNLDFNGFLIELQSYLNIDSINKILSKLGESDDISRDLKKNVANFLTKDNNAKPGKIIGILNKSKKLRNEIFKEMDKFILSEDDAFNLEENDKFKVLKGLIDNKIIEKNVDKNYAKEFENYVKTTIELLSNLSNKLEKSEIGYRTLSQFLNTEENASKLLDIIDYIYFK